jgi:hypothetical protein
MLGFLSEEYIKLIIDMACTGMHHNKLHTQRLLEASMARVTKLQKGMQL